MGCWVLEERTLLVFASFRIHSHAMAFLETRRTRARGTSASGSSWSRRRRAELGLGPARPKLWAEAPNFTMQFGITLMQCNVPVDDFLRSRVDEWGGHDQASFAFSVSLMFTFRRRLGAPTQKDSSSGRCLGLLLGVCIVRPCGGRHGSRSRDPIGGAAQGARGLAHGGSL